jgi:octaprenyl-diphosphate synthase
VLKSASRKERELIAQVLTKANPTAEEVEAVRELVLRKGGVKETLKLAKGFVARAKESISNLPESPFKTALKSVADFVVARTH